ncbi:GAF domain-containing protein [Variovorax sp. J22R24]|uniref:GAF domain-containing protein n=1 Tax=Variovorax gracilis TaxID=3053502 RepID=UPI0025786E21|nr:GAF domain-containing protein [Variovorax sp. J22R24]MDM0104486.1 GAF domain-containing protein [Variovorax sp. J22R24]
MTSKAAQGQSEHDGLEEWASRIATITAETGIGTDGSFTERCIGSLLRVVREQLNLEVVFVGEFVDQNRVFRQISAKALEAIIRPGDLHPLAESICQRIVDGRMPCLVPDVKSVRIANGLPDYYEALGAHIGVPVRFSDGSLYGVLCGFSFEPRADLDERDVKRLEMAAQATARLLAQADGRDVTRTTA